MKRITLALALVTTLTLSSCAAVVAHLPTVVAAVTDAMLVLDSIERFVALYFVKHPDEDKAAKVAAALVRARGALNAALRSAEGAKQLDQGQVDAAFAEFREAYQALIALVGPLGVQPGGPALRAAPDTLIVPEPMALSLKLKG